MAESDSKVVRNGCEALTREDAEEGFMFAMEHFENLETILRGIARIAHGKDAEIEALSNMGGALACEAHNDVDVLHERAAQAGLLGELVREGTR